MSYLDGCQNVTKSAIPLSYRWRIYEGTNLIYSGFISHDHKIYFIYTRLAEKNSRRWNKNPSRIRLINTNFPTIQISTLRSIATICTSRPPWNLYDSIIRFFKRYHGISHIYPPLRNSIKISIIVPVTRDTENRNVQIAQYDEIFLSEKPLHNDISQIITRHSSLSKLYHRNDRASKTANLPKQFHLASLHN